MKLNHKLQGEPRVQRSLKQAKTKIIFKSEFCPGNKVSGTKLAKENLDSTFSLKTWSPKAAETKFPRDRNFSLFYENGEGQKLEEFLFFVKNKFGDKFRLEGGINVE